MEPSLAKRLLPFTLTASVIVADQAVKAAIITLIRPNTLGARLFGDFLWIVHQRNTGVAFSLGAGFPDWLRAVLFIAIPSAILVAIVAWCIRAADMGAIQRWAAAGIVGGGFGNIIDRVIRPQGVVDFVSVKFYGLFGLDRWPTFNVADSSVVVCGILLVIAAIASDFPVARPARRE
ncbi:MAG: signal peptidase II [Spirochaetes bacterium]|nr:signal peptidase II [Spirochaetota bacterium]